MNPTNPRINYGHICAAKLLIRRVVYLRRLNNRIFLIITGLNNQNLKLETIYCATQSPLLFSHFLRFEYIFKVSLPSATLSIQCYLLQLQHIAWKLLHKSKKLITQTIHTSTTTKRTHSTCQKLSEIKFIDVVAIIYGPKPILSCVFSSPISD